MKNKTYFCRVLSILKLISRLPLRVLYVFSDFLFLLLFYVLRYRRRVVQQNLARAFPARPPQELCAIEKQFFKNLCDYGVEALKLLTMSKEQLQQRMHYKNPELLRPLAERNQSMLLLASHQFNWEWLLAAGCCSLPVPVDFVYQPQVGARANALSLYGRTRFGGHPVLRNDVAREVLKRRHITRGIAIVADQYPGHHNDKKYWATFLKQRTAFFQGINQLAQLTQYPAFYASVEKVTRGYYTIELVPLSEPPYQADTFHLIDNYIVETEKCIYRQPENWLWSHKRWKERNGE